LWELVSGIVQTQRYILTEYTQRSTTCTIYIHAKKEAVDGKWTEMASNTLLGLYKEVLTLLSQFDVVRMKLFIDSHAKLRPNLI
ncbi:hypothetical protein ACJX0J_037593, partial [Zea mays]